MMKKKSLSKCLFFIFTLSVISMPFLFSGFINEKMFANPISNVTADVSNYGIQRLEDVADLHFIGIYNDGSWSGFGSTMGLDDMDGDNIDDIFFGFGKLPKDHFLAGFRGGQDHIRGIVDMEEAAPSFSYPNIPPSIDLAVGDVNGDGEKDIALNTYYSNGSIYIRENGELSFHKILQSGGPESPLTYQYGGDNIVLEDLDGDKKDEIIAGYFYNEQVPYPLPIPPHRVNIYWGTGEQTSIVVSGNHFALGCALAVGDIDGDERKDLAIGSYNWFDENRGLEDTGSVFLFFNGSRLKGKDIIDPREESDCWIMGVHEKDSFGYNIKLLDLDGDGKEEIIIGSPGSDDIPNKEMDTGAIHIFKGGIEGSFPKNLFSNDGASTIIYGSTGKVSGDNSYEGDRIGKVFEIADLDGDHEYELITPVPNKDTKGNEMHEGFNAGAITIHETSDAFPPSSKYVKLSYPSKTFTIEGNDPQDVAGWQVSTGDFNADNISDILISVPGGDGINNSRQECGEVFLILGNGLRIEKFRITGDGYRDGTVITGEGEISFNITYRHTKDPSLVERSKLIMDPGGGSVEISMTDSGCLKYNDMWNSISVVSSSIGIKGLVGWMECTLKIESNLPMKGDVDIKIILEDNTGNNVTTIFESAMFISKDLNFSKDYSYKIDDEKVEHDNAWVRESSTVEIHGLVFLDRTTSTQVHPESAIIVLKGEDGVEIDSTLINDQYLSFGSDLLGRSEFFLEAKLNPAMFPEEYPEKFLPEIPDPVEVRLRLDDKRPLPPSDIILQNITGSQVEIAPPGSFRITVNSSLGTELDPGGSGIDYFEMAIEDENFIPMRGIGGLLGTYFHGRDFRVEAYEKLDSEIDFDWNDFGPDPFSIHYDDFSILWRGWITSPWEFSTRFRLKGSGLARLEIDGEEIIPWTGISQATTSGEIDFQPGSTHFIRIHYMNDPGTPETGIRLMWLEEDGRFWPVPESELYNPVNSSIVDELEESEEMYISFRSVDMVGHISENYTLSVQKDIEGPSFHPVSVPLWTRSIEPIIEIDVFDTNSNDDPGSGVDPESIRYCIISQTGSTSQWNTVNIINGENRVTARFNPHLDEKFRGFVQAKATDVFGNEATSPRYPLNVDMIPPVIELQSPGNHIFVESGESEFSVRAKDPGGSGVLGDSMEIKIESAGATFSSKWLPFGTGGEGSDLTISDHVNLGLGSYIVQFRVMDLVGNLGMSDPINITVQTLPDDNPPIPVIASPLNDSSFRLGEPILFDATGTSDDGLGEFDEIHLTWHSNISGIISTRAIADVKLGKGFHRITLYADDGSPGHNISTYVDILVGIENDDPTDPPDGYNPEEYPGNGNEFVWFLIILIVITILTFGGIGLLIFHGKRSDEEVKLEIGPDESHS